MTDLIGELTAELAALKTTLAEAYTELDVAEQEWLDKYDATFEAMQDEGREQGRKSDPAEHAVTSRARKAYPAEYRRWKNAKREIAKLEELGQSTRSEISAHQTRANQAGRLPTVRPERRAA